MVEKLDSAKLILSYQKQSVIDERNKMAELVESEGFAGLRGLFLEFRTGKGSEKATEVS